MLQANTTTANVFKTYSDARDGANIQSFTEAAIKAINLEAHLTIQMHLVRGNNKHPPMQMSNVVAMGKVKTPISAATHQA